MKLKFESIGTPEEYRANKKLLRRPEVTPFYKAIEKMEVGQSFEIEGTYRTTSSIRKAFEIRKWKTTINAQKLEKYEDGDRVFKIRAWRLS